jgi:hypothetical protein
MPCPYKGVTDFLCVRMKSRRDYILTLISVRAAHPAEFTYCLLHPLVANLLAFYRQ